MQVVKSVEEMQAGINALNLDAIKIKLMDAREGKGWSRDYADQMEIAYKRFLLLSVKYPEVPTVPTTDIDAFWHYHILDTMKYAEDCQNTFGFFLHHFPYLGMRGEEDIACQEKALAITCELYEKEFGKEMIITENAANCTKCTKSIAENAANCTKCTKSITENAANCTKCTKSIVDNYAIIHELVKPNFRPTFAA